jgi:ABC-type glycerol-3-phosphate transport system substrate-binding protein
MKKIILINLIVIGLIFISSCRKVSDKIEVKIGMWPESSNVRDVAMFEIWEKAFEEKYPEYDIIGSPYIYDIVSFGILAQAHEIPTVFQTWFTEPSWIVKEGHAKDITSIVKELDWYDKLDPSLRDYLTFDDKLYGIPRDGYGLGLVINLDLFAEYGVPINNPVKDDDGDGILDIVDLNGNPRYPTTMGELREYANQITTLSDGDVSGLILPDVDRTGGWQFSNFAWNFGANLIEKQGDKYVARLNSPEVITAMEYIRSLSLDGSLVKGANINYNQWYQKIAGGSVSMAICGNDVLSQPITAGGMNKDNLAFVPIPGTKYESNGSVEERQYTLFGGTPFMFSNYASIEAVKGAILFLEYMGRSPLVTEVASSAMLDGMVVATQKGMLILPEIKPWINEEYKNKISELNSQYINVNMKNFNPFFDKVYITRRPEEPVCTQDLYKILDQILESIINRPDTTNVKNRLDAANLEFQTLFLDKL